MCTRVLWNTNKLGVLAGRTMVGSLDIVRENALEWKSSYGSIIVSVYGIGTVDGFNEKGLAAHALSLKSTDSPATSLSGSSTHGLLHEYG